MIAVDLVVAGSTVFATFLTLIMPVVGYPGTQRRFCSEGCGEAHLQRATIDAEEQAFYGPEGVGGVLTPDENGLATFKS